MRVTDLQQQEDGYYMQLAIEQAQKGIYTTRPNPAVGCVLVKKEAGNNVIVGKGYHPRAGQPHAEVFALKEAKEAAVNSMTDEATYVAASETVASETAYMTAYVTLEPCSHTGKTPPCAQALIDSGVSRVVVAGLDPNPKVAGRGVAMLKEAGIAVTVGVATVQAEALNKGFLKAMRQQMPYVRLKIATSLDGKTAMASGESQWITGSEAREEVQKLRALSGAVITGSQTVIEDDPQLTVRSTRLGVDAAAVPAAKVIVLDRRGRLSHDADYAVCQRAETVFWRGSDLTELLKNLIVEHQCYDVLVEAGAEVAGSFLQAGLVDELIVFQAPCLLGHEGKPMAVFNIASLDEQLRFELQSMAAVGQDLKLVFTPIR